MKIIFSVILALTFSRVLQAQSISGIIVNPQRSFVVLFYPDEYCLSKKSDTIKLRDNGSFHYSEKPDAASLSGILEVDQKQTVQLWRVPGSELTIRINGSSNLPVFSGALARINQYLQQENLFFEKTYKTYENKHADFKKLAEAHSDGYFRITDSMTADRISFLKQSFGGLVSRSEKLFIARRETELLYQNLFYKISYPDPPLEKLAYYQRYFHGNGSVSFAYSDKIDFNNPQLLSNPDFLRFSRFFFMELVFRYQKEKKLKLTKEGFYDQFFSFINQLSQNRLCNAVLKTYFVNNEVNSMEINQKTTGIMYSRFVDSLLAYPQIKGEAEFIKKNFNRKLKELYALRNGTIAPACNLTDSAGNSFVLENFNGKLLYIDVWASWCGKCIEAMPAWNKLVNQYKDNKDVLFITVSTDEKEDKEKWLRVVNRFKPAGLHFISIGGANSEFAKKFLVASYPTNVLIDKEGRIININAENPETIDLAAYLKK